MKLMNVKFYMKGGHVVTAEFVKDFKIMRDSETGAYSGYEIKFERTPRMFTVSIPDIVAVQADDSIYDAEGT